ncbi:MAG: type II toxin-antitoxin system Phd/YefM family antitoxin [Myxococcota bacterium]
MRKPPSLADDLVPIAEFRSRTAQLLGEMAAEGRTLVVTQNGRAAAVVMAPAQFEALRERQQFIEEIARGLDDVAEGRTKTTAQLRAAMKRRRKSS